MFSQQRAKTQRSDSTLSPSTVSLRDQFKLKAELLCHGCDVSPDFILPDGKGEKRIHLYSHSTSQSEIRIPDDILLPSDEGPLIARVRYAPDAPFELVSFSSGHFIVDRRNDREIAIDLARASAFCDDVALSNICALLGVDVVGVTPYNYCFYFRDGEECRFCEILPTFRKLVEHKSAIKHNAQTAEAIKKAVTLDPQLKHLAITTGNYVSYDETARKLSDILVELGNRGGIPEGDVLGTLMPPDDLSLLQTLKDAGYTKVYFSLEVFREDLFAVMCPGKEKFGYANMKRSLQAATEVFGAGNVYTNFVYGIQSLNTDLSGSSYSPQMENEVCLDAVESLLSIGIMPVFTLYHYGGHNKIGKIRLDAQSVGEFFEKWGAIVNASGLVPSSRDGALFSRSSLSNTLFNDGLLVARST